MQPRCFSPACTHLWISGALCFNSIHFWHEDPVRFWHEDAVRCSVVSKMLPEHPATGASRAASPYCWLKPAGKKAAEFLFMIRSARKMNWSGSRRPDPNSSLYSRMCVLAQVGSNVQSYSNGPSHVFGRDGLSACFEPRTGSFNRYRCSRFNTSCAKRSCSNSGSSTPQSLQVQFFKQN